MDRLGCEVNARQLLGDAQDGGNPYHVLLVAKAQVYALIAIAEQLSRLADVEHERRQEELFQG